MGLYILYNLGAYDDDNVNNIGLYRDNSLMVVRISTNIKVDTLRNMINRELKGLTLNVKITTNVKSVICLCYVRACELCISNI